MAYITALQAEKSLNKILWCYTNDLGVYDISLLQSDIDEIEAEINSFVSVRYALPITDATSLTQLRGYALTLLRVRAYSHHPTSETPESILQEGRQTRGSLRDISSGAQLLGDAAQRTTGVRTTSMGGVAGTADNPQFTRAKLGSWG